MRRTLSHSYPIVQQRGYTLIEIMIALLVALFLLWGLGSMVMGTRVTSSNQTSLAQLQDEERLAMSVLNDVIQHAGYFDTSQYWNASDAFASTFTTLGPGTNTTLASGQYIAGVHASNVVPDSIVVRYSTSGTDGILNCNGVASTTGAQTYDNFVFIDTTKTPSQLECAADGNAGDAVTLVSHVVNMQIWYGVATTANSTSVDTYMTADQVNANNDWGNVTSARITLTFDNPLWGQPGQQQYVTFTRVVVLQSRV